MENWVKHWLEEKQTLYEDMIDFYRYKVIYDTVTDLSVDICILLASFVMDRYENNKFMLNWRLQHQRLSEQNTSVISKSDTTNLASLGFPLSHSMHAAISTI